ncbi:MAG: tRNA lysidine(34) synthetase TilS [Schaedlerella sp.]|nr:tRNA lysidine(34) synthetase TilS [Schaedlerella sp.]
MKKVEKYIRKNGMFTTEDRVIAGISGGADSVCLFFVLLELKKKLGIEFIAVHINHQIRGKSAEEDEVFVKKLCEKYSIKLEIFHKNVVSIAKNRKQSLEEAGRIVRREAFEEVLRKYEGTKIALAHHQNDNAETLLMNLSRGTGLKGLCGIRPVNGVYVRPLLCMSRREIEKFLEEHGESFCTDETNSDTIYTRNSLRYEVIPVLEKNVNTHAVRHMNEAMEQLLELEEYMEEQTELAWKNCVCEKDGGLFVYREALEKYPAILRKMLLRKCIGQLDGGLQNLGQVHVILLLELFEKQSGRSLDFPKGIRAYRRYEGVFLEKIQEDLSVNKDKMKCCKSEGKVNVQPEWGQELVVPGENRIEGKNLTIICKLFQKKDDFSIQNIPQKNYTKWFDYDIIESSLCVRTKKPGDRIVINKGQSKKLKSWFINEKIPAEGRKKVMLLADGDQIMWIIGHRMSSAYQITEHTKNILQVEITEEKKNGRQD